jgi:hypothetical protein
MGESFAEFIAAERTLERQAWARADAVRLPAAELASVDVFALRVEIADCHANQQPTSAALLAAIVDRAVAWWGHYHRPSGQVQVALAWCRPGWFTRCWCGALQVERSWHQPHPWPARSPGWRARPTAAAPAAQEASDA